MTLLSTGTDYDALAAAFRPIFTRIAQGAAEREQQRILPDEPIRWLKEAGFGTLRIPREKGGGRLATRRREVLQHRRAVRRLDRCVCPAQ